MCVCEHIYVACMCTYIFACVYTCTWRPWLTSGVWESGSLVVFLGQSPAYILRLSLSLSPKLCDLVSGAGPFAPGAPWVVLALVGIAGRLSFSPGFFQGPRDQSSPDHHTCRTPPWSTPYPVKGPHHLSPVSPASSKLCRDR